MVLNPDLQIKQYILGSFIGYAALVLRDRFTLLSSALLQPESVGMVANDQIASLLITKICRPEKTFIDVGAHIGSVIAKVHYHDKTIKIIAIEAVPEKATRLKNKFPHAEIHACALGKIDGETSFFVVPGQSGYSSIHPLRYHDSSREIKIPIRRLDSIVNTTDIDVVKIDVEGAELDVLFGMERILSDCRPTILFESGPIKNNNQHVKEALWSYFDQHDYSILIPNRVAHNDQGLSLDGFTNAHPYPRLTTNYFAVPKERRNEIRDRARKILGIRIDG